LRKIIIIIVGLLILNSSATIYFVKTDGDDLNDGLSWDSAFSTFQQGYNAAESYDQVWIAEGTYKPSYDFGINAGDAGNHFRLKNNVGFFGGFAGSEDLLGERDLTLHRTVLSGDTGIENDSTDNTYHVFYHPEGVDLDETAVIDGFVITGGAAKADEGDHRMGSGMFNQYSSPTIRNCEFTQNRSRGYLGGGGGIYNLYSDPVIENCIFSDNYSSHDGAGIFNVISSPKVSKCQFINNTSEFGTVFNVNHCTPSYTDCEFYDNVTTAGGGAMLNKDCSPIIDRCIMKGNRAEMSAGGAIWNEMADCSPVISNCLIEGNFVYGSKGGLGGGIYNYSGCTPKIINCTIVNNYSANNGGGLFVRECSPEVVNCIIWSNSAEVSGNQLFIADKTELTITNCCYSDSVNDILGEISFIDCLTSDPRFVSSGDFPFELDEISPCIDAGDNGYLESMRDLKKEIRVWDSDQNGSEIVDIGCYEVIQESTDFEYRISGNVKSDGQTDHTGCVIKFNMLYPVSGYILNTVCNENGDYDLDVLKGIYSIDFIKPHFYSVRIDSLYCSTDMSIDSVSILQKTLLAGQIDGFLPKNNYSVTDDLYINSGTYLIIEHGSVLEFDSGTGCIVNGTLHSAGLSSDSIRFVPIEGKNWDGLYFSSSSDGSLLEFSTIESSSSSGIYNSGGDIKVKNCRISGNDAALMGGALVLKNDSTEISDCEIVGNGSVAVYLFGSKTRFIHCNLSFNDIGGAVMTNSETVFDNCIVSSNHGYGIYNGTGSNTMIANTTFSGNDTSGIISESQMKVFNSIICGSQSGYLNQGDFVGQEIRNSCFLNTGINFVNCDPLYGSMTEINPNGVPCDTYENIVSDPRFVDTADRDFRLQLDSPCIDAGTNTYDEYVFKVADYAGNYRIWDGDGNGSEIVDMGAYEYGAPVGIEEQSIEIQDFILYQNYPNPFNPVTTISYALPSAAQVELSVYNLNGQLVQNLVSAKQVKGIHKVEFNESDLTSGMYIYSLKVEGVTVQSRKMMLVK